MRFPHAVLAAFVALALAACDGGGSEPPGPSNCATSADCPTSTVCLFAVGAGCSAQGECGSVAAVTCPPEPVCSCSGTTINACVVGGYVAGSAVEGAGACEGSAGALDSGADTGTDAGADSGSDASAD